MIGRGREERKSIGKERKIDWERKIDQKKEEYSIRYNNSINICICICII